MSRGLGDVYKRQLLDKSLSTTFCELEKYFQNKNEVLIGIIDYDFSLSKRKIKNISIKWTNGTIDSYEIDDINNTFEFKQGI